MIVRTVETDVVVLTVSVIKPSVDQESGCTNPPYGLS